MVPHVNVHGRRHHNWRSSCQIKRAEKIAGYALGEFSENVRRCRSNQQRIDGLCHSDMLDRGINIRMLAGTRTEHICNNFFAGECRKGERPNELLGSVGHDDLHADPAVL